eukprot:SAG22_NODE_87_length_21437_cov_14.162480_6_plen_138_part_00
MYYLADGTAWAGQISWGAGVTEFIANEVQARDYLHEIQGRGVQQQVQTVVDDAWDDQSATGELGAFDNIHLSILEEEVAEGGEEGDGNGSGGAAGKKTTRRSIVSAVDAVLEQSSGGKHANMFIVGNDKDADEDRDL